MQKACLELCFELERRGDARLLDILDAADARSKAPADHPGLTCDVDEDLERVEDRELDQDIDRGNERGPKRGR